MVQTSSREAFGVTRATGRSVPNLPSGCPWGNDGNSADGSAFVGKAAQAAKPREHNNRIIGVFMGETPTLHYKAVDGSNAEFSLPVSR